MIGEYTIRLKEQRLARACDYWVALHSEHILPRGIRYDQPTDIPVQILEVSHGIIPDPPAPTQRIVFEFDGHRTLNPGDGYIKLDGTFDIRGAYSMVEYDAYRRVGPVTADETLTGCPFCNGEAHISTLFGPVQYVVGCGSCGNCTRPKTTKAEAIAAWNRRA